MSLSLLSTDNTACMDRATAIGAFTTFALIALALLAILVSALYSCETLSVLALFSYTALVIYGLALAVSAGLLVGWLFNRPMRGWWQRRVVSSIPGKEATTTVERQTPLLE
jgi:uncharacterized membrane-anchored protein